MSNQKQRSATDRLNDVEQGVMSIFQALDNMARDMMLIKDAIKLLGNKVDSVVKVAGLSDDAISAGMIENNVAELKGKVDSLIEQGILAAQELIDLQSFIVVREVDDAGKVVNPRLQFTVNAIAPEVSEKLVGAKVGALIDVKEGSLKVEVLEIYGIQTPKAAEAPAAETGTEESPATETVSS